MIRPANERSPRASRRLGSFPALRFLVLFCGQNDRANRLVRDFFAAARHFLVALLKRFNNTTVLPSLFPSATPFRDAERLFDLLFRNHPELLETVP